VVRNKKTKVVGCVIKITLLRMMTKTLWKKFRDGFLDSIDKVKNDKDMANVEGYGKTSFKTMK